jgi:predicted kinase
MNRLIIMTVGKTHSGKTTFAKELEANLQHAVVIDQDNHAEFINTHYKKLRPKEGPNKLKFTITNAIVEYATEQGNFHLILSNSNLHKSARLNVLRYFHEKGFESIIVNFDLPIEVLKERVEQTQRSKAIFRSASSFIEVLERQEKSKKDEPTKDEANHLFLIKNSDEIMHVIQQIKAISELN